MSRNKYIKDIMHLEEVLRVIPIHRYKKETLDMTGDAELHRIYIMLERWKESQNSNG